MNYFTPTELDSAKLEAVADRFAAWLNGSSDNLKCLIEETSLDELKSKAEEARASLKAAGTSASDRQRATFACALFRDASYSFSRRGALLQAAASGRYGELLEAATFSKLQMENS